MYLPSLAVSAVLQYREDAPVSGARDAALRTVRTIAARLADNVATAGHPGARGLMAWLCDAARRGDISGFERKIPEYLQPRPFDL